MLQHREMQNEQLTTSWILVDTHEGGDGSAEDNGDDDEDDDVEFEEDFTASTIALQAVHESFDGGSMDGMQFNIPAPYQPPSPLYPAIH